MQKVCYRADIVLLWCVYLSSQLKLERCLSDQCLTNRFVVRSSNGIDLCQGAEARRMSLLHPCTPLTTISVGLDVSDYLVGVSSPSYHYTPNSQLDGEQDVGTPYEGSSLLNGPLIYPIFTM